MPSARATSRNTPRPTILLLVFSMPHFCAPARGHLAAIVAVPHGVLIEDVAEPVPLGAALQRHGHHVVGGADAALVEHARIGVGAGAQHGVDRVGAAHGRIVALGALRPGMIEIERERDHLAFAHQLGGRDDVLRGGVIERPDLVVRAPFAPVLVFFGGIAQILPGQLLFRAGMGLPSHRASFGGRVRRATHAAAVPSFTAPGAGAMMAAQQHEGGRHDNAMIRTWVGCAARARRRGAGPPARRRRRPIRPFGPGDRAVRGRRPDRRDRPHRGAEAVRDLGPAVLHREHAGRRRQYRRRHGGAGRRRTATPSWW